MELGLGSSNDIRWEDENTIYWPQAPRRDFACPLYFRGYIEASPLLCGCTRAWFEKIFLEEFGRNIKLDLIEAVQRGGGDCIYRIHLFSQAFLP